MVLFRIGGWVFVRKKLLHKAYYGMAELAIEGAQVDAFA